MKTRLALPLLFGCGVTFTDGFTDREDGTSQAGPGGTAGLGTEGDVGSGANGGSSPGLATLHRPSTSTSTA